MEERGLIYTKTITMVTEVCCSCGILFGIPSDFQSDIKRTKQLFYCPNGHAQSYKKSTYEIEIEKLKKDKEELAGSLANASVDKIQLEKQLRKSKKELDRVTKGVCPCCNRSFQNLHNHIKNQHPEYQP